MSHKVPKIRALLTKLKGLADAARMLLKILNSVTA